MSWTIDYSHSAIEFKARHMMISNVKGSFERFNGTVDYDETNPAATRVDIQIEAASIDTNDPKRDGHLRSPDFFDVEKFPTLSFKSKKVVLVEVDEAKLVGDLTIRDVTREVTLDVERLGTSKSPWGTTNTGFSGSVRINRKEWGLNWNVALETGGWLVSDAIDISIDLELTQVVEPAAEAAAA